MTDMNKDEDKAKIDKNEIQEENKIEKVDKDNKEKISSKEENDKNESELSEKENQNIDKNEKVSKDNIEGESSKNSKSKSTSKHGEQFKESSISSKGSSWYFNSTENLKNLEQIRKNLQITNEYSNNFNSTYDKMNNEEKKLKELYKEEDKINEEIEKGKIMNDDLFEYRTRKILSEKFGLKEYLCYPYFTIEYCQKKNSNMVKLYYYNISIESDEEMNEVEKIENSNRDNTDIDNRISSKKKESKKSKKKESKKKNADCFYFLDDRETYMLVYKNKPMIFHKINNTFNSVYIISEDFKSAKEFFFKKEEHDFITSFTMADINKELLEIEGKKTRKVNKLDSIKEDNEEKINLKKELDKINEQYLLLEEKYSKKNIKKQLEEKEKKLSSLMQKEKENATQIQKIKEEIKNYEMLLKVITIRINRTDQEFDGLFFSSNEFRLQNTIGDSLVIPPKKPIIIEVKNNIKYSEILDNIRDKKKKLDSLKLNEKNFYFIGILRGIDIDENGKKIINSKKRNLYFGNMIIIYPEKSKFLDVSLYEEKKYGNDVISIIMERLNDLKVLKEKVEKIEKIIEDKK